MNRRGKTMQQTVFIIDDNSDIVKTLRWLIESIGVDVKAFNNGQRFLSEYEEIKEIGQCIILDVRMKGMSGLKVQENLIAKKNHIPIIFLTGHGDIEMATTAMKRGAFDFFTKPFNNQQLLEAIQSALAEGSKRQQERMDSEKMKKRINTLSPRELEIMKLVVQGKLNKTIAYELEISMSTVEAHRASIMKKMEIPTLAELVKIVILHHPDL